MARSATREFYGQPSIGLPFGRGFIIDQDGRVDRPYFGHQPQAAIARLIELAEQDTETESA